MSNSQVFEHNENSSLISYVTVNDSQYNFMTCQSNILCAWTCMKRTVHWSRLLLRCYCIWHRRL